jgi:hypothetical protein
MTFCDYLLHLFYLIDTEIKALNLSPRAVRRRGPVPLLSDAEVISIELAGEFLRIDTDEGIFNFFRRYHLSEFPALALIDRSTFVRQAANLWHVKQLLHRRVFQAFTREVHADFDDALWMLDSFPLHVCRFARAHFSKCFAGQAAYGRDPVIANTFYGFRVHLRCLRGGPVDAFTITPGNCSDIETAHELAPLIPGQVGIADRNYWSPQDAQQLLCEQGFTLQSAFRSKKHDPDPGGSRILLRTRRLVETLTGQLCERFNCKRTRAKDLWHLCHRLIRKFLSHAAAMLINACAGNPPMQLDRLIEG